MSQFNLLGTEVDNNLDYGNNIKKVIKECFVIVATLKELEEFSQFQVRKQPFESLALTLDINFRLRTIYQYTAIQEKTSAKMLLLPLHAASTGKSPKENAFRGEYMYDCWVTSV